MSDGPELTDDQVAFLHEVVDLARAGETDRVADLVDQGVPVNLTNDNGDTLLILAAYHEHLALVRALLARHADPDRINDRGQTALAAAVFRQQAEIVRALLDAGADPGGGAPDAVATAAFFQLPEMTALLSRS